MSYESSSIFSYNTAVYHPRRHPRQSLSIKFCFTNMSTRTIQVACFFESKIRNPKSKITPESFMKINDNMKASDSCKIHVIISLIFCRYNGKNELYFIKIYNFLKNRAIFTSIAVKKDI